MRTFRATLAALIGAFLAIAIYLAWFFKVTHHETPWDGASPGFMALTAMVAAVCGLLAEWVASRVAPETPRGAAEGAAGFIALAALFAETHTPGQHHFAQMTLLLVGAPVAYFLGRLREPVHVSR